MPYKKFIIYESHVIYVIVLCMDTDPYLQTFFKTLMATLPGFETWNNATWEYVDNEIRMNHRYLHEKTNCLWIEIGALHIRLFCYIAACMLNRLLSHVIFLITSNCWERNQYLGGGSFWMIFCVSDLNCFWIFQ